MSKIFFNKDEIALIKSYLTKVANDSNTSKQTGGMNYNDIFRFLAAFVMISKLNSENQAFINMDFFKSNAKYLGVDDFGDNALNFIENSIEKYNSLHPYERYVFMGKDKDVVDKAGAKLILQSEGGTNNAIYLFPDSQERYSLQNVTHADTTSFGDQYTQQFPNNDKTALLNTLAQKSATNINRVPLTDAINFTSNNNQIPNNALFKFGDSTLFPYTASLNTLRKSATNINRVPLTDTINFTSNNNQFPNNAFGDSTSTLFPNNDKTASLNTLTRKSGNNSNSNFVQQIREFTVAAAAAAAAAVMNCKTSQKPTRSPPMYKPYSPLPCCKNYAMA